MKVKYEKIKQYMKLLDKNRWKNKVEVENILTCPCEYKTDNIIPPVSAMVPYTQGDLWGSGWDTHAWFRFTVKPTAENTFLRIETERNGWDADNPQFILYVNGKMVQGLDTNHRESPLKAGVEADVAIYAYTGPKIERAQLFAKTMELDLDVEGMYYDIRYPFEMLEYLNKESVEYARIVDYLWRAVSMLDLFDLSSEDFRNSVIRARNFMKNEFYEGYCGKQEATTVCIGHTHIDCAW